MGSRTTALAIVFTLVLAAGCTGSPGGRDLSAGVDVYVGSHDRPSRGSSG